jgi:plastocyanin
MRLRLAIGVLLIVAALVLASCGGDDDDSANASSNGKAPVELTGKVNDKGTKSVSGTSIDVEADDYYFSPTYIEAKPGTKLTIEIENEGTMLHSFTIDATKTSAQIPADKKATVTVTVPQSGSLNFYCQYHRSLGMQGAIVATP